MAQPGLSDGSGVVYFDKNGEEPARILSGTFRIKGEDGSEDARSGTKI